MKMQIGRENAEIIFSKIFQLLRRDKYKFYALTDSLVVHDLKYKIKCCTQVSIFIYLKLIWKWNIKSKNKFEKIEIFRIILY